MRLEVMKGKMGPLLSLHQAAGHLKIKEGPWVSYWVDEDILILFEL